MYPTFSQFCRWATHYRAIPLWVEPELPAQDVLAWAHSLAGQQQRFFLLHSAPATSTGNASLGQARYSYIALDTPRYSVQGDGDTLTVRLHNESGARQEALKIGNPYDRFQHWLGGFTAPRVDALPPFWGGAVGYFSYESSKHLEPKLVDLFKSRPEKQARSGSPTGFSEMEFGIFDAVAVVDHARGRLWLINTLLLPEGRVLSPIQLERLYRSAQDRLRRYAVQFQRMVRRPRAWGAFTASDLRSNCSEAAYKLMVRRAKGFIAAGDIYQCNLSQSFSADWSGDPWSLYRNLTQINPSPYAGLWRSGARWMVSASPELLLRQEAGRVETRPIAGTYPRDRAALDPKKQAAALVRDAKERAEHIMLVDLERNDLGRICLPSSIRVGETLTQETYSHVIHLVSDVRGMLAPGRHWRDVMQACFPGGTITGCPKLRSMEIIHKLEGHKRGPYTGALGWIGFNGDMTMNILIRTIFLNREQLYFPVGAGIVADSNPEREYQETLHKARALLEALQVPAPLNPRPRRRS